MEYARRRRRRRKNRGGGSGAGRLLAALLLVAGAVYLLSASAVGTWVAERVMAPAFTAMQDFSVAGLFRREVQPIEQEPAVQQVSLSAARDSVSAQVSLPAMECYALQMGVFASEENAHAQAAELQQKGAGGYVHEDGGRYRVLAAGYAERDSAVQVKERLCAEGTDCAVYQLSAPAATFRVSAQEEELNGVREGFLALYRAQEALCAAALEFDQQGQTEAEGKEAAAQILQTLREDMAALQKYSAADETLRQMTDCGERFSAELEALSKVPAQSYAAQFKRAQLSLSCAYAELIQTLAG